MTLDEVLAIIESERGGLATIHTAYSDFPEGIYAHYQFYKSLMLIEELPLDRASREFLATVVSETNGNPQSKFLAAGFTRSQWQHAIMVISYFNFANRCAHAMDLEIEQNFKSTCS